MNDNSERQHSRPQAECPRTRLAQGSLAAVDVCNCGMMQVHLGAITLRMAPCALAELLSTLGQAMAANAAREFADKVDAGPMLNTRERGEA